jgi:hypothetical protein
MSSLKVVVSDGKAVLSGHLDEHSDLSALKSVAGPVVVNFKEVDRVNSCGVREWVNLLAAVDSGKMTYEDCPMVVVKQLNAVPDFQGKAKVTSFQAPYFCEECDSEALKVLQSGEVQGEKAPELKCETCSKPLNFDAIPNQYFSFIKRAA